MRLRAAGAVHPHPHVGKLRLSRPGDPSVVGGRTSDEQGSPVRLIFYYFQSSRPCPPGRTMTLERAARDAFEGASPEIFELPDHDCDGTVCFGWYGHFAVDPNSQFSKKVRGLDAFGYYVR